MSFTQYEPAQTRLQRSELAVPGSDSSLFEKAAKSATDYVFLDCEDAVIPDDKAQARRNIIEGLNDVADVNVGGGVGPPLPDDSLVWAVACTHMVVGPLPLSNWTRTASLAPTSLFELNDRERTAVPKPLSPNTPEAGSGTTQLLPSQVMLNDPEP